MEFPGFTSADREIFAIPDFAGRMGAIRAQLRPKLVALAEELAPEIAACVGGSIFPHAAAHMRRRVNPPAETWAAFARDSRGYKRWAHFRVAISAAGVRVVIFVEDDAEDKPLLARSLSGNADRLATLPELADLCWYSVAADRGEIPSTRLLGAAGIRALGEALGRQKTLKFQAGIPLGEKEAFGSPARLQEAVLAAVARLRPLYLGATQEGYRV